MDRKIHPALFAFLFYTTIKVLLSIKQVTFSALSDCHNGYSRQ